MIHGAARMPMTLTPSSASVSTVATRSTNSLVSPSPFLVLYSARIGTKAWEKAPSANRRRSRLGIRKATKNASVASPAPNRRAITASRTKPRMRDTSVMALTVASARRRFMPRLYENALAQQGLNQYHGALSCFILGFHHGQYRFGAQAFPPSRQTAAAQRQPALEDTHGDQGREQGNRGRRQSPREEGARPVFDHRRPHRRQEDHPQEQGLAPQEPPRRRHQGDGLNIELHEQRQCGRLNAGRFVSGVPARVWVRR